MFTGKILWRLCRNMNYTDKIIRNSPSSRYIARCLCTSSVRLQIDRLRKPTHTPKNDGDISPEENLKTTFTIEQQSQILKALNESSLEELLQYALSKARASKLIRHRKKNGHFPSIHSLLEVDGFGVVVLEKLCDTIAYGTGAVQKRYLSVGVKKSVCQPKITEELRKSLESVVAVRLLPTQVVWVHLRRDMTILDWTSSSTNISTFSSPAHINLELADKISKLLPEADAYLMDQRSVKVRHVNVVPALCTLLQIESMLMAILKSGARNVFVMKDSIVSGFFRIRLGNEKVSGKKVVDGLLSGMPCTELRKVNFKDESLHEWYNQRDPTDREELGNCLLQAVAFYELEMRR